MMLRRKHFKTIQISSTIFKKPRSDSDEKKEKQLFVKKNKFVGITPTQEKISIKSFNDRINKKTVLDLKSNIAFFIKNNTIVSFFTFLLFIGIITGTVLTRNANEELIQNLKMLFLSNYTIRASQPMLDTFMSSIISSFIFVILSIIMGLSMWGSITIPILIFFKGLGFGLSSGYIYLTYGFKGILFNLVIVLPGAFLSCLALIISSKESIKFSYNLFFSSLKKRITPNLKEYFINVCRSFIMIAIASVIDMLFSWWFAGLFKF